MRANAAAGQIAARRLWWRLLHEALLLGVLWGVYTFGRALAGRHVGAAGEHASQVWRLERWVRLPDEAAVQAWALRRPDLVRVANGYYAYSHWVGLVGVAALLLVFRVGYYLWFRRVLVLTTALGLAGHLAYPLAPPRMRPDFGLVDTGVRFGQSVYGADPANHGLLNQYAAMPSLHVAWAVLFAAMAVVATRSRWRWLAMAYPIATTWVVVVTANHYWLDGIAGVLLLGIAAAAVQRRTPVDGSVARRTPRDVRRRRRGG